MPNNKELPSEGTNVDSAGRTPTLDPNKLVGALIWPLVFLIVALFAIQISRRNVAIKTIHLSAKELEISFNLLKAAQSDGPDGKPPSTAPDVSVIQQQAEKASKVSLEGSAVLWVDDNPNNNDYERRALEAIGLKFAIATSTHQALDLMSHQKFSLIISDFARADDPQGGYTLLRAVRDMHDSTPLIIFSASANAGFDEDSRKLGAVGETNDPQVLFDLVIDTVKKTK